MYNTQKLLIAFSLLAQIIAAILYFVPIEGYHLLEYYQFADPTFAYPALTFKQSIFFGSLIVAAICIIMKWLLKDKNEVFAPQNSPISTNWMGIAGFILALMALILFWMPIVGKILWVLGWIFSYLGIYVRPKGLAIAGVTLSFVTLTTLTILLHFV